MANPNKQSKKHTKYKCPTRKKVGRNWYVVDRQEKIVEGLAFDTGNGYYFYSAWRQEAEVKQKKKTRKDYQFGRDYDDAIYLFRQWAEEDKTFSDIPYGSIDETGEPINTAEDAPEGSEVIEDIDEDGHATAFAVKRQIDDGEIWTRARSLILQDIREASRKLGFPALLDIEDKLLEYKSIPKLTISDIYDFYWEHTTNKIHEKRMIRRTIEDFKQYIKDENIIAIDEYDVISYDNYIHDVGKTSNFINKRIARVITCLNFYNNNYKTIMLKENLHDKKISEIVKLVKEHTTKAVEEIKDTPKTFETATLIELFQYLKKDQKLTLVNLLALNGGFTPIDIEHLKKKMIRQKDGITFISYPRIKTQKTSPRVIILWDATIQLLDKYMEDNPNSTEYIFLNQAGTNLKRDTIQKRFRKLKNGVKHMDGSDVFLKNYKDTVASSLVYKVDNTDLLTITLGHDFGGKKKVYWKYIETKPSEILCVSEILYEKFKSVIDSIQIDDES